MVCESFGCLPSQAIRELADGPAERLWRILDMRSFAQAKAEYERTKRDPRATIEESAERTLVEEITDLADRERFAERRASRRRT